MKNYIVCPVLLSFGVLLSPAIALADRSDPPRAPAEPGAGQLLIESDDGEEPWLAPQVSTEVRMVVTGMIARAHVEQVFENPSEQPVEAVYVFPLPDSAAVDGLTLKVGQRKIVGEIRERQDAERQYEMAASAGKKASLVTQERPNLFTTSVANIAPGELVTVSISYQEDVRYDHGEFSLMFPSTLTPRYNPGAAPGDDGGAFGVSRVADARRITPPVLLDGSGPLLDVRVKLDAGVELQSLDSPSHDLDVSGPKRGPVAITLKDGPVIADRDFRLRWRPVPSKAPRSATFTEDFGGERYALLMLLPPTEHAESAPSLARETTFVVDTSGSMAGGSIEQAQSSLRTGLEALAPRDYFNVIEFNSSARSLFTAARPASPENIARATEWVKALSADGGTEMMAALQLALAAPAQPERVQQVVFITDGAVGNEDELFGFIERRLGERRLFTVGIGSAPNRHFMRGAARFGRGTFTEVSSLAEVATQMNQLWTKLDSPVMRDVALDFGAASEVWPERAPDLYAGEPLVVFAKLGAGVQSGKLTGTLAARKFDVPLSLGQATAESGIHRLWARRKIEGLMDRLVEGSDEGSIRSQVVPLALTHHLVSKYTSLVAIDPRVSNDGRAPRADVAAALPAGNQMFGNMPQTATPGPLCLLFGVMSMVGAALVSRGGAA